MIAILSVFNMALILLFQIEQHRKTVKRVERMLEREFAMETDSHTVATISRIWRRVSKMSFLFDYDKEEP